MRIEVERQVPRAAGPYSPVVEAGPYIFCSGQLPIDPQTGNLAGDDIGTQTDRVLDNVDQVLRSIGSALEHVIKTTVFLTSLDDFEAMNTAYGRRFAEVRPARSTIGGVALPRGARIEIDAIARRPNWPDDQRPQAEEETSTNE